MDHHDKELRDRINLQAGRAGVIAKKALHIDWYDTESQARRVAEHAAEMDARSDQYITELRRALKEAREFISCQGPRTERVGDKIKLTEDLRKATKVLGGIDYVLDRSKEDL